MFAKNVVPAPSRLKNAMQRPVTALETKVETMLEHSMYCLRAWAEG